MSVLQTVNLSTDAVKMRWKEPYVTAGINQKFIASHPKGVLAGFGVVPSAGFVVAVQLDPSLNLSVANVLETTGGKFSVTVVQTANVLIDLTAQANTTVFIVLDAQYTVGATSAAQVKVVDAAELSTNLDLVVLAKVNVPLVGPITTSHINLGYRDASGDFGPLEQNPHFNLVHNPSFEASTVGWTNVGFTSMTASTDTAHSANYSLKLVQAAPGLPYAVTGPMPVVPARAYRTTAWLRSTGSDPVAAGNGAKVQVGFYDSAGAQIGGWTNIEAAWTGGSTTWEVRRSEVTAPTLALTAKLRVFFDNAQGTLYVDDVEFASHMHDEVMKSAVFGGAGAVADDWHKHTALGLTYAGSPNWADGTNIPAGTIESGVDGSPGALGPTTGATKVGFTPTPGVDITVGAPPNQHVSKALNELDTKKAGLAQPNVFTKNNVITSSVTNTAALTATGNGDGSGVSGTGGATSGAIGVAGTGGSGGGIGVTGQGTGSGSNAKGGEFYTSALAAAGTYALGGLAQNTHGIGVYGSGTGTEPAVKGVQVGTGAGGSFQGAGPGAGVLGIGGGTVPSTTVWANQAAGAGAYGTTSAAGANGVVGVGGGAAPGTSYAAPFLSNGVLGVGAGTVGFGVMGVAGPWVNGAGVYGYGGFTQAHGVRGRAGSSSAYGGFFEGQPGEGLIGGLMYLGGPGLRALGGTATDGGTSFFSVFPTPGVAGGDGARLAGGTGGKNETGNTGGQAVGGPGGVGVVADGGAGAAGKLGSAILPATSYAGGPAGAGGHALSAVGGAGGAGGDANLNGGANPANGGAGGSGSYALYAVGGSGGNGGAAVNGGTTGVGGNGGVGIYCQGGSAGTGSVAGTAGFALEVGTGHAKFSGGNPGITTGYANTLTAKNICKAWGSYICNAAGIPAGTTGQIQDGFNLLKITHDTFKITVWFATPVLSTNYTVVVTMGDVVNLFPCVRNVGKGTSTFDIELVTTANTIANPTNFYVQFVVYAAQ